MITDSYKTFSLILAIALQGIVAVFIFAIITTNRMTPVGHNGTGIIRLDVLDGWIEYINNRELYKFEHPVDWQVTELVNGSIMVTNMMSGNDTPFMVSVRDDKFSHFTRELELDGSISKVYENETVINGYAARELGFVTELGKKETFFYIPIGVSEVVVVRISSDNNIHKQMLETVEFLK